MYYSDRNATFIPLPLLSPMGVLLPQPPNFSSKKMNLKEARPSSSSLPHPLRPERKFIFIVDDLLRSGAHNVLALWGRQAEYT